MKEQHKDILIRHFPEESVKYIFDYIKKYNIYLRITRKRKYKLGDYRPPNGKDVIHKISVNGDLNPYAALLVFLHELSHLLVWNSYKKEAKPHGKEWKDMYGYLISVFIERNIFPYVLKTVLEKNIANLKASFFSNPELYRTLTLYDNGKPKPVFLEEMPEESKFIAHNGKTFIKQNKLRKRFRCLCLDNRRMYLFHPLAQIKPIS